MHKKIVALLIGMLAATLLLKGYASTSKKDVDFHKIFSEWTQAFNQKHFPKVCELFAKSISADYQGSPSKNYSKICDGFKKIFEQKNMVYHNSFKIHKIYRSNNLAVVRITWYLDIYNNEGKHISSIQEEGLDIFQKQKDKKWQIVNFIAYPVSSSNFMVNH